MTDWRPEIRAALRLAIQWPMSADAERHIRRALHLAGDTQEPVATARCIHDSAPCSPECTISRALRGRCGRGL